MKINTNSPIRNVCAPEYPLPVSGHREKIPGWAGKPEAGVWGGRFMVWKGLPDVLAISLLIYAFVSAARHGQSTTTRLWLAGWVAIACHFVAVTIPSPGGAPGVVIDFAATMPLLWAAQAFMHSLDRGSLRAGGSRMFWGICTAHALYVLAQVWPTEVPEACFVTASLYGLIPLGVLAVTPAARKDRLQILSAALWGITSLVLLGLILEIHGLDENLLTIIPLSVAYLGCAIHFWVAHERRDGGYVVTVVGFVLWALVFPAGEWFAVKLPQMPVEAEVWNLPKYLVAVGMLLMLLEEQLRRNQHLAHHDPLTGLPNRRLFEERLSEALARSRRGAGKIALLALDLDRFKQVNDSYGHHVGDLLLQEVARVLQTQLRVVDTIARVGGDEFSIVLEAQPGREEAQRVSQDLRRVLGQPIRIHEHTFEIGASIGVALFPDDAPDASALCILADQRMYLAKHGGVDPVIHDDVAMALARRA